MKKTSLLAAATVVLVVGGTVGATTAGASTASRPHAAKPGSTRPHVPAAASKRGPRGKRGKTGDPGPVGDVGPQGPAGPGSASGGFDVFNQLVPFNGTETVTIGQFTISEVATASGCSPIKAVDNSSFAGLVSVVGGLAATAGPGNFVGLAQASPKTVANANNGTDGDVDTFSAVLSNGTSSVTGTVGGVTLGGGCLTTGTLSGE